MTNIPQKINEIEGKVNNLYKQMEALDAQAKNYLSKSKESKGSAKDMYKQKCLMALKKKKQLQQQAQKLNNQQNMLQQAVFNIESASNHKQMYEGMKQAVDAQKMAMKSVDIDKIMDVQDEMLDMKMQSDMMNEMLGRNYDMDIDEDQFEDEFMEFEKQVAKEKKQNIDIGKKQEIKGQYSNNIDDILKM